ncbi:PB1 domain-containing protein [Entamoeba marina]
MSDIVVKLEYMNDIRISLLNSITINELYAAFQKKFNLKDMRLRPRFLLKYLDLDGDWITLTEDSDIHIALQQLKQTTMRLKLVDSYQTANSSTNEEWDLRPLFSQLLHSPSIQTSISKMVENILLTSNQVVEVRTKPDTVKMPLNYKATISDHEPLPVLDDEIEEVD